MSDSDQRKQDYVAKLANLVKLWHLVYWLLEPQSGGVSRFSLPEHIGEH